MAGVQIKIVCGEVKGRILMEAEQEGVDLIVMGTHGRGDLFGLLMGSVCPDQASDPVPAPIARNTNSPRTIHHAMLMTYRLCPTCLSSFVLPSPDTAPSCIRSALSPSNQPHESRC
ncbi:MAG: universal stress protein [Proteobacteria bacterium]|nr:universal stress protein [Pseudomonadota bacterium]MBU1610438.1 universal stress protein [Pseudomonadota bacterium]